MAFSVQSGVTNMKSCKIPTIFFSEGPGFIYIQTLGKGKQGIACLVRCINDGKLYVRKEEHREEQLPFAWTTAQDEAANMNRLNKAKVHSIAKMRALYRYRAENVFDLTERALKLCTSRIMIPQKWIANWLDSMIQTMTKMHECNIVHNDAHSQNWFIHRSESGLFVPQIVLGDFGLSEHHTTVHSPTWRIRCCDDYLQIPRVIDYLTGRRDLYQPINRLTRRMRMLVMDCRENAITLGSMVDCLRGIQQESLSLSRKLQPPKSEEREALLPSNMPDLVNGFVPRKWSLRSANAIHSVLRSFQVGRIAEVTWPKLAKPTVRVRHSVSDHRQRFRIEAEECGISTAAEASANLIW